MNGFRMAMWLPWPSSGAVETCPRPGGSSRGAHVQGSYRPVTALGMEAIDERLNMVAHRIGGVLSGGSSTNCLQECCPQPKLAKTVAHSRECVAADIPGACCMLSLLWWALRCYFPYSTAGDGCRAAD